jgi:hydroxymethylpyrimidine/phosphomethylpyrimidine kinase
MPGKRPYCLTIAGFDPSGGAGIVADCKTFEQLRVQGLSVLTANTVQTEDAFVSANWIPRETILAQLDLLLERYPVRHVKIGLVENAETLLAILDLIHARVKDPFILWDPVLTPTAGGNLPEQRFSEKLPEILQRIRFMTPNIPECEILFGNTTPAQTAVSIYLKGGHAERPGSDLLFADGKQYPFRAHITTTRSKHGTGCILSAAILAHLSRRFPLVKTCLLSKRYVERALISNNTLLSYHSR